MKINKYINAFIATALMAVGVASCTNDDTVDDKNLYIINLKTTGLDEAQQSEFEKVVKSKTFGVDVTDAHQQVYGLYSSEAYARARYQEIISSSMVLDSIVNVYADQSNNVDFSVNVVLMKDSTAVLGTSESIKPTIQRENYQVKINQNNGSLVDAGIQTLAELTEQIMGVAPNGNATTISCTPGYAKSQYLSVLPAELATAITTLVPEKGAPKIFEDFSEKVTLSKDNVEVGEVTVYPYCDYVAWFDITPGSLSESSVDELYGQVKQDIFNGLDSYPWDKRQKIDRSKAIVNYSNLMITNYNAIQKIVNNFAAMMDITDFSVNFHLSVADGVTAPVLHDWYTFDRDMVFKANIVKENYKIGYEVAPGSLSAANQTKVNNTLAALAIPVLDNIYEANALLQFNSFLSSTTAEGVAVKEIAQYLAKETKTLDFVITFSLYDSKGNAVDKLILKANEGWKTGN